jgi:hypothetical protein
MMTHALARARLMRPRLRTATLMVPPLLASTKNKNDKGLNELKIDSKLLDDKTLNKLLNNVYLCNVKFQSTEYPTGDELTIDCGPISSGVDGINKNIGVIGDGTTEKTGFSLYRFLANSNLQIFFDDDYSTGFQTMATSRANKDSISSASEKRVPTGYLFGNDIRNLLIVNQLPNIIHRYYSKTLSTTTYDGQNFENNIPIDNAPDYFDYMAYDLERDQYDRV